MNPVSGHSTPTVEWLVEKLNERLGYSLRWPYLPEPGQPEGETTTMLLRALLAMHQGKKVAIVAHNYRYATTLYDYLRTWALHTDLGKRDDILVSSFKDYQQRFRGIDVEIFIDHNC